MPRDTKDAHEPQTPETQAAWSPQAATDAYDYEQAGAGPVRPAQAAGPVPPHGYGEAPERHAEEAYVAPQRPGWLTPGRVVALVLLVLLVVFALVNRTAVPVDLVVHQLTLPLWLLLAISFVIGLLIGLIGSWHHGRQKRRLEEREGKRRR